MKSTYMTFTYPPPPEYFSQSTRKFNNKDMLGSIKTISNDKYYYNFYSYIYVFLS